MDSKVEKLIRQNLGHNGELRVKKDLVDSLVDLVKENCQHELEGLTQRLSLRSKSISTSGVSSWNIQNISSHHYSSDDFVLIQRKIKSVCDVAAMEPEFKRIKSRILRICHKISLQSQRSSSETRTSYSSAGSSDTILATSVLSFGQSIKSIDGKELEYLIKVLNSDEDAKAKQSAIKSLMTMPVFGMIRSRSLVGLVNSLTAIIPNRQLFEPSMELLIKLLASNDYRPWTEVMDKINEMFTAVNTSFEKNSVERYQFSDFCYQILSRSSAFYRSFSVSSRSKMMPNILNLFLLSSANNSGSDLLSIYSKMDPDANFIKMRLFNFSDRQVFLKIIPDLMSNINDLNNLSSCQKCFVFCMLNHFVCYEDLIGHMDLKVIIDHIGSLLDFLFCDKKMRKEIRKMAGKALLQASQSESGANFYFTHLFPSILSIRTYISVQFLINIFKLSEFNPELDREENDLLREFVRRCLHRRQHTIFSLSMELIMLIYRKNRDLGISFIIENNLDDRLDPKNILHSRILFIGRHSQIMWRHYNHIFLVSSNLHLISHQIEINSIEDRRFLAKSIVNFLSREDSAPSSLRDHGPLIQIILLDFNFISEILRSMDFGFLLEERFKQLYAKKNYGFLYNLALMLYNPEVLIEVRRQFSIWTRLLQFAQISHSNGIKLDESTDFMKLLILRILMATPSEISEIKLYDFKNPSIQQLFRPREEGISVIFPIFDFTELQKPMWETFLDSESEKEWSLRDLLDGYVKHHDVKRSVDSEPLAIPDWIYPLLDYAVGLGKERSRRRLLSRLQNFKFLSEKPDFFVSVLLLTTDFDVDLATEFLLRVPEGQVFWPRSFASNSGFYEEFHRKTYQFMNKVLSEPSFRVVNDLINDLKVPFYHLVSSWIQRCYLGMLSMDQLAEFMGYQIIFGQNFTGYFCIVILQFLSERIDLSEKNLEHFLLPDLSEFTLRNYLIEFKKLERIRIHKSD